MKNRNLLIIICFTFCLLSEKSQAQNHLIDDLIKTYGGKWPKTISFTQNTYIYTDTSKVYQRWYEIGIFPDYFRIDFDKEKGNSVIFNGDKQFRFNNHQLTRTSTNNNPLIYLVGGMYFDSASDVKKNLTAMGVDVTRERKDTWKGKKVRIIGQADQSQLWYDAEHLYLVRFKQKVNNQITMDFDFYGHQNINGNWHETRIDFYQNGKLTQEEIYSDYKTNIEVNPAVFDPNQFGKVHWLRH